MSKTEANLQEAFAGESQANRRYLAYAEQADKEGFAQVAKLFRAVAAAETVHAHAHLRTLGAVKSTADNLKEALAGEVHEFKSMYPAMIDDAKAEGQAQAQRSFEYANTVEETHAGLYTKAAEQLGSNEECDYYVCKVCGHTCEHEAPERCPVCNAGQKAFFKVD